MSLLAPLPNKKFSVIYADPPWKYSNTGVNGAACKHYPTLTTAQICSLDVASIAEDNAALFLWATWPNLDQAFKVMESWSFTYKTCGFVWVKMKKTWNKVAGQTHQAMSVDQLSGATEFGPGFYVRANSEVCLIGIRGSMRPSNRSIRQIIFAPRGQHSAKPPEARRRIELLYPNATRIELFARERAANWDGWGDEMMVEEKINGD